MSKQKGLDVEELGHLTTGCNITVFTKCQDEEDLKMSPNYDQQKTEQTTFQAKE